MGCGCLAGADTSLSKLSRRLPTPLLPQPGFLSQMMPPRACLGAEAATPPQASGEATCHPPQMCSLPRTWLRTGCPGPGRVLWCRSGEAAVLESNRQRERGRKAAVFSPWGHPRSAVGRGLGLDVVSPPRAGPCFRRADAMVASQGRVWRPAEPPSSLSCGGKALSPPRRDTPHPRAGHYL